MACAAISDSGDYNTARPKVVGFGSCGLDYLAAVAAFPKPDEKLRTTALEVPARRPFPTRAHVNTASAAVRYSVKPSQPAAHIGPHAT